MDKPTITKYAVAFFCIPVIGLLIAGLLMYWRDLHNVSDLTFYQVTTLNQMNVTVPAVGFLAYDYMLNTTDEVVIQLGILNNCNFKSDAYKKCEVPKDMGFVGDTVVLSLLCVGLALYVVTFFLTLLSISSPKVAYIVPLTCLAAFLCTGAAVLVFLYYETEFYQSYDKRNALSDREREAAEKMGVTVHDYYSSVKFPLKITGGTGFWITYAACLLSWIPLIFSFCFYKSNDDKSDKSIKNHSIPPRQKQPKVQAAQQQQYPSQANQYSQQPHQGYPQQLQGQLPPYQYQQHQGSPPQIHPVHPSHQAQPYPSSKRSSASSVVSTSATYV